ncbi:N-acetylglucosamine kinase [Planomicrobium sp. CPCC 101079]|uniref:N-acetylglucosamine kinase n=1 Tax=Planomicrobium sp. CPCC 101079 TaxID=2599618 RepID=UPI0011B4D407|nr:BadF/BadG/BcrA/BcrD ATPase family protein [Planomicrobium sp. CPCC 101079]TWT13305.1 hypothetical protein FQV28_02425 [Planomicrobium sp. CPCC 101079]
MYVLGIDGGGTKTTGMVADDQGEVYMQAVTGRSNPNTLSQAEFHQVMENLLLQLKQQDPSIFSQLTVCFAGMAGVGESGRAAEIAALLKRHLPLETNVIVKNDAVNALYAGTAGEAGIVQIAGTGAIAYGINESGQTVRSGGWGYLFDDEGSGFDLGKSALRAVFRQYDGRGSATSLTERVLAYFGAEQVPDLIAKVYGGEHPRSVISPLAPFVIEEAKSGDQVAQFILEDACTKMLLCIEACHQRLFEKANSTPIVLSGGVFTDSDLFIPLFEKLARESLPNAVFQPTQVVPAGGALIAGLKSQGIGISKTFMERVKAHTRREEENHVR